MKIKYVRIECQCSEDGNIIPKVLIWDDGRRWAIDRVIHSCSSGNGEFEGIRYTVKIGSAEKNIYRLGTKWYVMQIEKEAK